jgi:tRNA U34 5-carboxymethylaminomethyl modifying GTPase MnmE/TrmE
VERLGIQVARRYLGRADLVLFCVEAERELGDEEMRFIECS